MSSCYDTIPGYDVFECPSFEEVAHRIKELGQIAGGCVIKPIKQCNGCGATSYVIRKNKKVCEYCGNDQ